MKKPKRETRRERIERLAFIRVIIDPRMIVPSLELLKACKC